ncbi:MAG: DUF1819 family protein [Methanothrix sp.]|nr:BrxA family protein [Methanothrix sp.]MCX8207896.1 DUF1819 family protein [Methanothrix sp.]
MKSEAKRRLQRSEVRRYSSRILKAGALLDETKTLLGRWNNSLSIRENLDRFLKCNILGKQSRSRAGDILDAFRQRYLTEEDVTRALVALVGAGYPSGSLDRVLYFHTAMSDPLIHDFVIDMLWPRYRRGIVNVDSDDAAAWIREKLSAGQMVSEWSDSTIERAASGLLAAARDFGVLSGSREKRICGAYLPTDAFAYIAFYLSRIQPSGRRLLESEEWLLFFMEGDVVEMHFMEAHQQHLLNYQAAGSVIRISFPAQSMEEYAHVILERAHRAA